MLKLRISDTRSHAEEFSAATLSQFTLGLYEALTRYRNHFSQLQQPAPRPHLHIRPNNSWGHRRKWIDAGYGTGTHIILYVDMMKNTAYLSDIWDRCQHAANTSDRFDVQWSGMLDEIVRAVHR